MNIFVKKAGTDIDQIATFPFDGSTVVTVDEPLDFDRLEGYRLDSSDHLIFDDTKYRVHMAHTALDQAKEDAEIQLGQTMKDHLLDSVTDEEAVKMTVLYPEWSPAEVNYVPGTRLQYEDQLYKVLQSHLSQPAWNPKQAVSLFARVLGETVEEWQQPDSTNPYMAGQRVIRNGKTYESLTNNNVWEPGAEGTETVWAELAV